MALEKIVRVSGRGVYVPGDDIDTDRIIPARFMKCVTFEGLGKYAFYDVRFDSEDKSLGHPFDDSRFSGASVLLSGSNFGCGSSREHAPQALYRYGIRAIVAESFAEIFAGNSTMLGIPCVTVSRADIAAIAALIEETPSLELDIDLEALQITIAGRSFPMTIPAHVREALLSGRWDSIADLLDHTAAVAATAEKLGYARV